MALNANGELPKEDGKHHVDEYCDQEDYEDTVEQEAEDEVVVLSVRPQEAGSSRWLHAFQCHQELKSIYSWLDKTFECPWCGEKLTGTTVVHHPFDAHVMTGQTSIDSLCSWIASIEPEPYAPPPSRQAFNLGLGILFASEQEKQAVLQAAAEAGLKPGDFITTAVRLVMERRLSVARFQREAPDIGPGQDVSYSPYIKVLA
jgi:hypothetical protein